MLPFDQQSIKFKQADKAIVYSDFQNQLRSAQGTRFITFVKEKRQRSLTNQVLMNSENIFDELNLPLASSNEDLETLSGNHFRPLFDLKRFEIRSEHLRDKGIDFHIELKQSYRSGAVVYTNFRFAIQLKATDAKIENKDGSVSLQLQTSNINYLLNSVMPAFYVLYVKSTGKFYFEYVNDFAKRLYEKNEDWNKQVSHTLRFERILDEEAINWIYELTFERGNLSRELNNRSISLSLPAGGGDKIQIDGAFTMTDDAQIREMIEGIGFEMINEGRWSEVIALHKEASGAVASSAKYNVILGVANYYAGFLADALPFFKAAGKMRGTLDEAQAGMLRYFEETTKFSMGLITEENYRQKIDGLSESAIVGLHVKLDQARARYEQAVAEEDPEAYTHCYEEINRLISDPRADSSVKYAGESELMTISGHEKNSSIIAKTAQFKIREAQGLVSLTEEAYVATGFLLEHISWRQQVDRIQAAALREKNFFAYFSSIVNEAKVAYVFAVYINLFVRSEFGSTGALMPEPKPTLEGLLETTREAEAYFTRIKHNENLVATLSVQYEILHYLRDGQAAAAVMQCIEEIIETNELGEKRERILRLKNKGTIHETTKTFKDSTFQTHENNREEYETLSGKIQEMDQADARRIANPSAPQLTIQLFPLGLFCFPEENLPAVYQILGTDKQAQEQFSAIFKIAAPIANLFYDPITKEGYVDGVLSAKGVESMRRIYRVRKAFFDNKFYNIQPKQGNWNNHDEA